MNLSIFSPPIYAYTPGTFALFTVKHRLPSILSDVRKQLHLGGKEPAWDALATAIANGEVIDLNLIEADTLFWRNKLAKLTGAAWRDLSFFDLEFLFYKAINSIAQRVQPGIDVFASQRRLALHTAIPNVARVIESLSHLSLKTAVNLAVSGNEFDLSQLQAPSAGHSTTLLIDHSDLLIKSLTCEPEGTVQILADNAGTELCYDLVLVDEILKTIAGTVVLQLKPNPMFVSDALIVDVEETISEFIQAGGLLRRIGSRLIQARATDRFRLEAPPDWSEPRYIDALKPELLAALRAANIVIVKGDLNYRRFFGDCAWPADTSVKKTTLESIMNGFALRVLKSDCLVGILSGKVDQLSKKDPCWKSRGIYSIIQHITEGEN